jgi:sulfate transport system ATP-binding protein
LPEVTKETAIDDGSRRQDQLSPVSATSVAVGLRSRASAPRSGGWLRDLHPATHLTTLLVTQDQEEAMELSDQIVVVDKGRIHQVGSPREVYDAPKTSLVVSFVGTANAHGLRITKGEASVYEAVGRVRRIARLTAYVKLGLEIATGEVATVQLTRREFEEMKLADGEAVVIDLDEARVFVDDYAI